MSHPVPLLGVATVSKATTSAVVVPDIEEAVEAEEIQPEDVSDGEDEGEQDIDKDKYIKQKGSNVFKAASGKGAKSTRGRGGSKSTGSGRRSTGGSRGKARSK